VVTSNAGISAPASREADRWCFQFHGLVAQARLMGKSRVTVKILPGIEILPDFVQTATLWSFLICVSKGLHGTPKTL
jgi:hypothetical protein